MKPHLLPTHIETFSRRIHCNPGSTITVTEASIPIPHSSLSITSTGKHFISDLDKPVDIYTLLELRIIRPDTDPIQTPNKESVSSGRD